MRRLSQLILTPLASCAVLALNDRLSSFVATSRLASGYYPFTRKQTETATRLSFQTLEVPKTTRIAVASRVAAMHDIAELQRRVTRCILDRPYDPAVCLSVIKPQTVDILKRVVATHKKVPTESPQLLKTALKAIETKAAEFIETQVRNLRQGRLERIELIDGALRLFTEMSVLLSKLTSIEVASCDVDRETSSEFPRQAFAAMPSHPAEDDELSLAVYNQRCKVINSYSLRGHAHVLLVNTFWDIALKEQFAFIPKYIEEKWKTCKNLKYDQRLLDQYNELMAVQTELAIAASKITVRSSKEDAVSLKQIGREMKAAYGPLNHCRRLLIASLDL